MKNWKRILAAVGTAALLASNLGAVTQTVFADGEDITEDIVRDDDVQTESEVESETGEEQPVEEHAEGGETNKEETNTPEVKEEVKEPEAEVEDEDGESEEETTEEQVGENTKDEGDEQGSDEETVVEPDTESASVVLTYQELGATIYTDSSKTEVSTDEASVTLSGDLPDGATVEAYPIDLEIEGQVVLAAYDITIWVDGEEYEPDENHPVSVKFDVPELKDVDTVNVYHVEEDKAPDLVHEDVTVRGEAAEFKAVGFSGYAVAMIANEPMTVADTYDVEVNGTVTIYGTTNTNNDGWHSDSWTSSDTSIASVSKNNIWYNSYATVTGKKAGTVTITHTYYTYSRSGWDRGSYTEHTETFIVNVTAHTERNTSALVYALKSPTGTPRSNDTNQWTNNHNWVATVNMTGATWVDNNKNVIDDTPSYMVKWPDGTTESTWTVSSGSDYFNTLMSDLWSNYQSEVQKDLGIQVNNSDVESITLTPFKISKNNGTDPDYHVDCTISIKCKGVYTAKFWVKEVGKSGYENVYSKNYRTENSVDEWTYVDNGTSYSIGSTKTVNGTTYKLIGWYVEDSTGSEPGSKIATWKYKPTTAELSDGAVNFYAEWVETGNLTVIKTDKDTGERLPDAQFTLYQNYSDDKNRGTVVATKTTDSTGAFTINNLYGDYTLVETDAPDGYELDNTARNVTIQSGKNEVITVTNELKKKDVTVVKVDAEDATKVLEGAEFTLYKNYGTDDQSAVGTGTTGTDGKAVFKNVPYGTYTLVETKAPAGYQIDTATKTVVVDDNTTEITVTDSLYKTNINLTKVDADTNSKVLAGATFTLSGTTAANETYSYTGTIVTGEDGKATISNVPDGTYTLTETAAPTNYKSLTASDTIEIVIDKGIITEVTPSGDAAATQDGNTGIKITNKILKGNLVVEKKVDGDAGYVADDREFEVVITLTGVANETYGTYVFDDKGQCVVKIRKGTSITIPDIEYGTLYGVEESSDSQKGFTVKYSTNKTGNIESETTTVTVTNSITIVKTGVSLNGHRFQAAVIMADVMVGMFLLYGFVKRRLS